MNMLKIIRKYSYNIHIYIIFFVVKEVFQKMDDIFDDKEIFESASAVERMKNV